MSTNFIEYKAPLLLKIYSWIFVLLAGLQVLSCVIQFAAMENNLFVLQNIIFALIPLYIGYGMLKGKQTAFTILYFVTFFYSAFALLLILSTTLNTFLVGILISQVLFLFIPPLIIVRKYWDQMEEV